ncbi:hypothetical protein ES708_08839 [subsurface metagenome]
MLESPPPTRPPGAECFCQGPPVSFSLFPILSCFIARSRIPPFFCCFSPGSSNKPAVESSPFPLLLCSPPSPFPTLAARAPHGRTRQGVEVLARPCRRRGCRRLARSPPPCGQLPRPVAGSLSVPPFPPLSSPPNTICCGERSRYLDHKPLYVVARLLTEHPFSYIIFLLALPGSFQVKLCR